MQIEWQTVQTLVRLLLLIEVWLVQEQSDWSLLCWLRSVCPNTVELQWLKHLWNHENMFETGVVQASEC